MPVSPGQPVDAIVLASRGAEVERSYLIDALPRVKEAGAGTGTSITVRFRFGNVEEGVGVDTHLTGTARLVCQRCLGPVDQVLESGSQLVLLGTAQDPEQTATGREPLVVDAERLDLRWLAEEEALLALPLVPLHEGPCERARVVETDDEGEAAPAEERHRPFENLRELLKKQ